MLVHVFFAAVNICLVEDYRIPLVHQRIFRQFTFHGDDRFVIGLIDKRVAAKRNLGVSFDNLVQIGHQRIFVGGENDFVPSAPFQLTRKVYSDILNLGGKELGDARQNENIFALQHGPVVFVR